eukprot:1461459-Rhodomonas_salina.1
MRAQDNAKPKVFPPKRSCRPSPRQWPGLWGHTAARTYKCVQLLHIQINRRLQIPGHTVTVVNRSTRASAVQGKLNRPPRPRRVGHQVLDLHIVVNLPFRVHQHSLRVHHDGLCPVREQHGLNAVLVYSCASAIRAGRPRRHRHRSRAFTGSASQPEDPRDPSKQCSSGNGPNQSSHDVSGDLSPVVEGCSVDVVQASAPSVSSRATASQTPQPP